MMIQHNAQFAFLITSQDYVTLRKFVGLLYGKPPNEAIAELTQEDWTTLEAIHAEFERDRMSAQYELQEGSHGSSSTTPEAQPTTDPRNA